MQISANKALVATTSYSSRTSSAPAGRARTIRRSKPVSIPLPLFHFIFAALLLGTPLARAEPRDSAFACAIPTPEFPANKPASKGINLGLIAKQNLGFYGAYKATVEPTVQLDFGRDEEIVNLTQSRADKKLVFEPSRDGYRVLETARLELGLGANFNFEFGNSTFLSQNLFAAVGLLPLKGSQIAAERFYALREDVQNRKKIPLLGGKPEALDSLAPNDSVEYLSSGGIVFWASAGFGFLANFSASALAKGDFRVHVEKIDSRHVYVKISESELQSLALQSGNGLVNASISDFSLMAKYLGFEIDFTDELGAKAFHDLVLGNAAPVQKLALEGASPAIRFMDEGRFHRSGKTRGFIAKIPLLAKIQWTSNRFSEVQRRRYYECERTLNATYGTYSREREGSAFGVKQKLSKAFYGASYALRDKNENILTRGFFGQLIWSHKGNNILTSTFENAMKELAKETGFGQQLLLEIPAPKNLRLAYSSISLRAHFSAEHILSMMERAREIGRSKLSAKAKIMAARALEDSALNSSLCPPSSSEAGFPNCAETLIRDVENGVDLMVNSMEEMKKELENGDEKAATKAFARFGEAMLMNQFTFQTGLLLSEQSLPVDYILEGSEFQRFIGTAKVARGKILPAARQLMFGAGPDESTLETIAISPAF